MTWAFALVSVVIVSLASLVGVFTLAINEQRLRRWLFVLVALAAGALFGDVLIHLLPEAFELSANPTRVALFVLGGILIFFILEKFLHWSHHHHYDEGDCDHVHPLGQLSLISDGLHNFIDGLIIGVSYLAGIEVGLATTLAVILHEIPQEIGDFAILLHAGYTKSRALLFNFFSACLAILGTVVVLLIGQSAESLAVILLPLAAGGFLYIAGSDLVPELHKTTDPKRSVTQLVAMLTGIALMLLLTLLE